jgi:hypothetical protein
VGEEQGAKGSAGDPRCDGRSPPADPGARAAAARRVRVGMSTRYWCGSLPSRITLGARRRARAVGGEPEVDLVARRHRQDSGLLLDAVGIGGRLRLAALWPGGGSCPELFDSGWFSAWVAALLSVLCSPGRPSSPATQGGTGDEAAASDTLAGGDPAGSGYVAPPGDAAAGGRRVVPRTVTGAQNRTSRAIPGARSPPSPAG